MKRTVMVLVNRLRSSIFIQNVIALMSGAGLAQLIVFFISPILTRIYDPEAFGFYATYVAIVSIAGSVATGKYELGVVLPEDDASSRDLVRLGTLLALAVSGISLLVITIYNDLIARGIGWAQSQEFLLLVPPGLFCFALIPLHINWRIRKKDFKLISVAKIAQSGGTAVSQVLLGLCSAFSSYGLMIGQLLGQVMALLLLTTVKRYKPKSNENSYFERLKKVGQRYGDFPRYMLVAGLVNKITTYIPVLIFGWAYTPAIVGLYALAQRVIQTPMSIVGGSISDVFLQKASELAKDNPAILRKRSIEMTITLLAIAIIPVTILILFGPFIFDWVFGEEWREAGAYAQVMAVYLWFQFGFSPLCRLFTVTERQAPYQAWELIRFLLVIVGTGVGVLFFTPRGALVCFTISMVVSYIILGFLSYHILRSPNPKEEINK